MINFEKVEFYYNATTKLTVSDTSFKQAVSMVFNTEVFKNVKPLKCVFPESKTVLYFHEELFKTYLEGDIDKIDLVIATRCDELYRNRSAIFCGHDIVDQGSLWMRQDRKMILINDDLHITHLYIPNQFDIATK